MWNFVMLRKKNKLRITTGCWEEYLDLRGKKGENGEMA
jgi:hypothetical protein